MDTWDGLLKLRALGHAIIVAFADKYERLARDGEVRIHHELIPLFQQIANEAATLHDQLRRHPAATAAETVRKPQD